MTDWSKDEFMSSWDQKYVSTNLKSNAKAYEKEFFLSVNNNLAKENSLRDYSYAIVAAACCAVGRADVVGQFFDYITADLTPAESELIFLRLREAVTIIFPYLGMPTCIPACYGMIGVVQRKGRDFASTRVLRKGTVDEDDATKGKELRARIYQGVGNSEIFDLMNVYFTDLFTCSTIVSWGYLVAKTNEEVYRPEQSHLVIATAIMALGATRQTKSHIKATLGIGNSVESVKVVVNAVSEIAEWAGRPVTEVNVEDLALQIQAALKPSQPG